MLTNPEPSTDLSPTFTVYTLSSLLAWDVALLVVRMTGVDWTQGNLSVWSIVCLTIALVGVAIVRHQVGPEKRVMTQTTSPASLAVTAYVQRDGQRPHCDPLILEVAKHRVVVMRYFDMTDLGLLNEALEEEGKDAA